MSVLNIDTHGSTHLRLSVTSSRSLGAATEESNRLLLEMAEDQGMTQYKKRILSFLFSAVDRVIVISIGKGNSAVYAMLKTQKVEAAHPNRPEC